MSTSRLIGLSSLLLCLACPADDTGGSGGSAGTTGNTNPTGAGDDGAMPTGRTQDTGDTNGDMADADANPEGEGPDSEGSNDDAASGDGCCERHPTGGCNEPAVAECVCAVDPACCTFEWDDNCVDSARNMCDATCEAGDDAVDGNMDTSGSTSAGIMDTGSSSSDGVMDEGNMTETGPMDEGGGAGDCCMTSATPGCVDPEIETCVCVDNDDPFCCEREWDLQCVQEAGELCGGMCVVMPGDEDCCVTHATTGCDDMAVESCVCDFDPFCCNEAWDEQCVDEAQDPCMAAC